jgi:hypothetical protein
LKVRVQAFDGTEQVDEGLMECDNALVEVSIPGDKLDRKIMLTIFLAEDGEHYFKLSESQDKATANASTLLAGKVTNPLIGFSKVEVNRYGDRKLLRRYGNS